MLHLFFLLQDMAWAVNLHSCWANLGAEFAIRPFTFALLDSTKQAVRPALAMGEVVQRAGTAFFSRRRKNCSDPVTISVILMYIIVELSAFRCRVLTSVEPKILTTDFTDITKEQTPWTQQQQLWPHLRSRKSSRSPTSPSGAGVDRVGSIGFGHWSGCRRCGVSLGLRS